MLSTLTKEYRKLWALAAAMDDPVDRRLLPPVGPVAVPWGRKHAVRCVGRCSWMCVFGLNSGTTKLEDAKTRLETLERLHAGLD